MLDNKALDNVPARMYLERKCLYFQKPMPTSASPPLKPPPEPPPLFAGSECAPTYQFQRQ